MPFDAPGLSKNHVLEDLLCAKRVGLRDTVAVKSKSCAGDSGG